MPLHVITITRQALLRDVLRTVICASCDIEVVAATGDSADVVELTRVHRPDVILMDGRTTTPEALTHLCTHPELSATRVLLYADDETDTARALRTGVAGLLSQDATANELLVAIRAVAAGGTPLSQAATRLLITRLRSAPRPGIRAVPDRLASLTPREREVTALAAQGRSNPEIAEDLRVSPLTVRTHIHHALTKLDARNRAQLVAIAYRSGLVAPRTGPRPVTAILDHAASLLTPEGPQ
jgi:DNA-binding NarL/FixJ family response regulator